MLNYILSEIFYWPVYTILKIEFTVSFVDIWVIFPTIGKRRGREFRANGFDDTSQKDKHEKMTDLARLQAYIHDTLIS